MNFLNLEKGDKGAQVALLQTLFTNIGYSIDARETRANTFGDTTAQALLELQQAVGHPTTGKVGISTLTTLVSIFKYLFNAAGKTINHSIPITILNKSGKPVVDARIEIVIESRIREEHIVQTQQPFITNQQGKVSLTLSLEKLGKLLKFGTPTIFFHVYYEDALIETTKNTVNWVPNLGNKEVEIALDRNPSPTPTPPSDKEQHIIQGQAFFDNRFPATGLEVLVYQKGFGAQDKRLGTASIDAQGGYSFEYDALGTGATLELRILGTDGKEQILSRPQYNVGKEAQVNVVIPRELRSEKLSEFTRLTKDLNAHLGGASIGDAKETKTNRDFSFLYQQTGWDSRVAAVAAKAEKTSSITGIPKEAMYGLLRAGLPADVEQLALVDKATVTGVLEKTNKANITTVNVDESVKAFTEFSQAKKAAIQLVGGQNSMNDFLDNSDLTAEQKDVFLAAYFEENLRGKELWGKVGKVLLEQIGEERSLVVISKLQKQGKLSHLTLNNAALVKHLSDNVLVDNDLQQLVSKGFYNEANWKDYLWKNLAEEDEEKLEQLIPNIYIGATPTARLNEYAADMARKITLTFPTQVMGQKILNDEIITGPKHNELKESMNQFLVNATIIDADFAIQKPALGSFIAENKDALFKDMPQAVAESLNDQIKVHRRLYQITPDDASMNILYEIGIQSADDIIKYERAEFLKYFGDKFQSLDIANLLYSKAEQVSTVTYNFYGISQQVSNTTSFGAWASPSTEKEVIQNKLIKAFPTLENLFGSLDYCECEHCRSVLSPAAYLVDLLQFLDADEKVWKNFKEHWDKTHDEAFDLRYKNPYEVLVERRPDITFLELTCENTTIALPYIDVVNEILECYVVDKNSLGGNAAINTPKGTSTTDLLAEPQNIFPKAYEILALATYPTTLPFDFWTEMVRSCCNHFDTPLWKIMNALNSSSDLSKVAPNKFAYSDIFMEYLGLNQVEQHLYTRNNAASWYKLYGYPDEVNALGDLKEAKTLTRKLEISYKELVALIKTEFINPNLANLATLKKLGLNMQDVFSYMRDVDYPELSDKEREEIENRQKAVGLVDWIKKTWDKGGFEDVLVLYDTNTACSFDDTKLRYANGNAATNIDFLKINLFIRLWKKLDWSITEIDELLVNFTPTDFSNTSFDNISKAFKSILIYTAHLKYLDNQLDIGKNSKIRLLSLWNPISTTLYEQLFLHPVILREDKVFEDEEMLEKGNIKLNAHINAVQSVFNLTIEEIELILEDNNTSVSLAVLNKDTLSLLHRYAILAKGLDISVSELIRLKSIIGINPFTALEQGELPSLEKDHPYSKTIKFVDLVLQIQKSEFEIGDIIYLLKQEYDEKETHLIGPETILDLAQKINNSISQIQEVNNIPEDIDTFDEESLMQSMSSIFTTDIATTFNNMWLGTMQWKEKEAEEIEPADKLSPELVVDESKIELFYDEVRKEQSLTYTGVLLPAELDRLKNKYNGNSPRLYDLLEKVATQARNLFKDHIGFIYEQGTDLEVTFNLLFDLSRDTSIRKNNLVPSLLRYAIRKQTRNFVIETLQEELDLSKDLSTYFLDNLSINQNGATIPVKEVFMDFGTHPISLRFSPNKNKEVSVGVLTPTLVNNANNGILSGYFQVPSDGDYRLYISSKEQAVEVELELGHLPDPLLPTQGFPNPNAEISALTTLKANFPYHFKLTTRFLKGEIKISIQGDNLPKTNIGNLSVFSTNDFHQLSKAYQKLHKASFVLETLDISNLEVQYISKHSVDFGGFDFDKLPSTMEEGKMQLTERFTQFMNLLNYTAFKNELIVGEGLIAILQNASKSKPEDVANLSEQLADLVRRPISTVKSIVDYFGFTANDLKKYTTLEKIWKVLQLLHQFGIRIEDFDSVISVLNIGLSNDERYRLASNFKNVIKARYSPDNWNRIAPSIFDPLRQKKRDALVAYIMHQNNFERPEQLFEYFLIDSGMEPVVKTSRIKLALSALQTFIQRCLLNLEGPIIDNAGILEKKGVHPSTINSKHWQWMKRYRVWEANRKIFLYPENWLEPEFRDDKTHLFQELEGTLLQGDVSKDLVETAFFQYLKQLEKISRLDMRAMYCEEVPLNPSANTIHVLSRTFNLPHEYYYRTYSSGEWTPIIPVDVQIEGNHTTIIKWKERVHIFWLTFLEKPKSTGNQNQSFTEYANNTTVSNSANSDLEIQLNWCEYFQEEWLTRESGGIDKDNTRLIKNIGKDFDPSEIYVHATKNIEEGEDQEVEIHITTNFFNSSERNVGFKIQSKLSLPEEGVYTEPENQPIIANLEKSDNRYTASNNYYTASRQLQVEFTKKITKTDNKVTKIPTTKTILSKSPSRYYLLVCNSFADIYDGQQSEAKEINSLISPFFYSDNQNTFFVEPELTETISSRWENYVIPGDYPIGPDLWEDIPIEELFPNGSNPLDPGWRDPSPIESLYGFKPPIDWLINPGTAIEYIDSFGEKVLLGETGRLDILTQTESSRATFSNTSFSNSGTLIVPDRNNFSTLDLSRETLVLIDAVTGNIVTPRVQVIGNGGLLDRVQLESVTERINKSLNGF